MTYEIFNPRNGVVYATDIPESDLNEALETIEYLYPDISFDYDAVGSNK